MDKVYAAIRFRRQCIEDFAVKNKGAKHLIGCGKGRRKGGVVIVAQIAAEPDKGFFVFHGWFVP